MKTNLKNRLLSSTGVAVVAMLLGSNVGYALDNYEILTHNLSHAGIASTGGTGGGGTGTDANEIITGYRDEPGGTAGVDPVTQLPIFDEEKYPLKDYVHGEVESWEQRTGSLFFESTSDWSVTVAGKYILKSADFKVEKESGKKVNLIYTYEMPICRPSPRNICSKAHIYNKPQLLAKDAKLEK